MSTLRTVVRGHIETTELLTGGDLAAAQQVLHNGYDVTQEYTSTSSPDVTGAAFQQVNMSGGAVTIDLTSIQLNGNSISLSGKNPRALRIQAIPDNAGDVTVVKGASNGYTGLGASFSMTLKPGQWVLVGWPLDNAVAVGSGVKTLDLSGAGTDGVYLSAVGGT